MLEKSRERSNQGLFAVEGIQENRMALENKFEAELFFLQQDIFQNQINLPAVETLFVSQQVFQKIAYRSTTEGVIGVYKPKTFSLTDIQNQKNALLVILESVEKPGNLGAVLRSADAAGADAVIVCDARSDFFNPNVIRSSVGTIFTQTIVATSKESIVQFCEEYGIQILPTYLGENSQNLYDCDLTQSTALVFGTESQGLSDFWLQHNHGVKIPMAGQVDSLNVSNAVAVALFEAVRQRSL
ncbi:MAG: RNA methyltransferase [Flavobacteriaceae bacterium]|nr:RNA methyltransferase [Flavobacteriaceae bacterium]